MKYPQTVKALAERICQKYPHAQNQLEKSSVDDFRKGIFKPHFLPAYLLWMLQELETFNDREKAARWLGWVMGKLDGIAVLDVVTIQENRDLIRADKQPLDPHDPQVVRAVARVCLKEGPPGVDDTWG